MPLIAARAALTGATSSTATLDTASSYWIAKNTATYYNSGTDALIDRVGSSNLQLGSTSSSGDAEDPAFGNDGVYERLRFDGSDDYLTGGSGAAFDPGTGAYALLLVIKPLSVAAGQLIYAGRRTAGSNGYNLYRQGSALWANRDSGTGGNPDTVFISSALTTTAIHGVANRYDGANLYAAIDGTQSSATASSGAATVTETFWIGRSGSGLNTNFDLYGAAWWKGSSPSAATLNGAKSQILALAAL